MRPRYVESPQPVVREYLYKVETVTTQALQATGTAFLVGVLFVILGYYLRWRDPLVIAGVIAAGTWVITWLILQRAWLNSVTIHAQIYQAIWTGEDEREPEAEPLPEIRVRIERVRDGHFSESVYRLPISQEQLEALASGLLRGVPFSERAWTGGGKPFSLAEFRALRSELLRRSLLELANEKDARQGYTLTEEGRAVMEEAIAPSPPLPLRLDGLKWCAWCMHARQSRLVNCGIIESDVGTFPSWLWQAWDAQ